jgi:hypothetical protein
MSSLRFQTAKAPREVEDGLVRPSFFEPKKGVMAAIDYATCGVNDVIAHSLKLHPRLLADRLRFYARVHAQFADAYDDSEVMRNELDLADQLHFFADAIERGDHTIPGDFYVRREAFSCAACLQDLHPIMQNLIAEREQAHAPLDRSG